MKVRAVYPGTFDPIHNGHLDIARRAAALFDELIVAVYDKPLKSLVFSPEQRMDLVRVGVAGMGLSNVRVQGYSGLTFKFCKLVDAQVMVRGLRVFSDFEHEFRIALANNRLAPEIETVTLLTSEQHSFISSTTVREIASLGGDVSTLVPPHVELALQQRYADSEGSLAPMTSLRD